VFAALALAALLWELTSQWPCWAASSPWDRVFGSIACKFAFVRRGQTGCLSRGDLDPSANRLPDLRGGLRYHPAAGRLPYHREPAPETRKEAVGPRAVTDLGRVIEFCTTTTTCKCRKPWKTPCSKRNGYTMKSFESRAPVAPATARLVFTRVPSALPASRWIQLWPDNGLLARRASTSGDLVIYRDDSARRFTQGWCVLVETIGLVLVESKWGPLGSSCTRQKPTLRQPVRFWRSPRLATG